MSAKWRTVRVFISSTFRDMHAERDYLVKRVFPALRERLQKYRIHLVDIDLRWGITEEEAQNDRVLDLCLQQIDECRPFFIGILGERYGWVPGTFDDVASKYGWVQHETGKSVTELEILYGVLRDPEMHARGMFFFRDPKFAHDVPVGCRADVQREDAESGRKLAALKQEIRDTPLTFPVYEDYPCHYAGLRINWQLVSVEIENDADRAALHSVAEDGIVDPGEYANLDDRLRALVDRFGVVHLAGLEEFGNQVYEQLWQAIKAQHDLPDTPLTASQTETDPLAEEADYHEKFMESRLRVYVGREEIQRQLTDFANSNATHPCLVTGPSGSGKSAVMARFAHTFRESHPEVLVVPHFVGASPGSTSLRQMLRRFCLELQGRFGFTTSGVLDFTGLNLYLENVLSDLRADEERRKPSCFGRHARESFDLAVNEHWPDGIPGDRVASVSYFRQALKGVRTYNELDKACSRAIPIPQRTPSLGDGLLQDLKRLESGFRRILANKQNHSQADEIANRVQRFTCGLAAQVDPSQWNDPLLPDGASSEGTYHLVVAQILRAQERIPYENAQDLVDHFCRAIDGVLPHDVPGLVNRFRQAIDVLFVNDAPHDVDQLASRFAELAQKIPIDAHVALIIDGLDQLDADDNAYSLFWLPKELPSHVKIVISCINAPHTDTSILNELGRRPVKRTEVAPLSDDERLDIAAQVPSISAKKLAPRQIDLLLSNPATRNPLFLLVALEELRGFSSYEQVADRIAALPQDVDDPVGAMFGQVIGRLREEFDSDVVRMVLALIACSRNGMSEQELLEMIEGVGIGQSTSDLFPVLRQLRPYMQYRGTLLDFFHRGLHKATQAWYVPDIQCAIPYHEDLVGYFHRKAHQPETESSREDLRRGLGNMPYHQTQGELWKELEETLTSLAFLEKKTSVGMIDELADDFSAAVKALPSNRPMRRILQLLVEALRRDIRFIDRHTEDYPQALFQCLWNSCWWYDCHEAAHHYVKTESEWKQVAPWDRDGAKLSGLLSKWREELESRAEGIAWVRALRPPPTHLGTPQVGVLHVGGRVAELAVSPDGRTIVSASMNKLSVWDARSGKRLRQIQQEAVVSCLAFLSNGRYVVSGSACDLVLWEVDSGKRVHTLQGHTSPVSAVAISADRMFVVSGSQDGTVISWDGQTGRKLRSRRCHKGAVSGIAVAADGSRITTIAQDRSMWIWTTSGERQLPLPDLCVAISPDGKRIVPDSPWNLIVINAETGQNMYQTAVPGSAAMIHKVNFSPGGDKIAACVNNHSGYHLLRLWNAENGEEIRAMAGHSARVTCLAFFDDGNRIASGSDDGTVRIWDSNCGEDIRHLHTTGHQRIMCIDGKIAIGASFWDWKTGHLIEDVPAAVVRRAMGSLEPDMQRPPQQRKGEPYHVVNRDQETVIVETSTEAIVAYFPGTFFRSDSFLCHYSHRRWAGVRDHHLYVLQLIEPTGYLGLTVDDKQRVLHMSNDCDRRLGLGELFGVVSELWKAKGDILSHRETRNLYRKYNIAGNDASFQKTLSTMNMGLLSMGAQIAEIRGRGYQLVGVGHQDSSSGSTGYLGLSIDESQRDLHLSSNRNCRVSLGQLFGVVTELWKAKGKMVARGEIRNLYHRYGNDRFEDTFRAKLSAMNASLRNMGAEIAEVGPHGFQLVSTG